jgi:hypothetical protein
VLETVGDEGEVAVNKAEEMGDREGGCDTDLGIMRASMPYSSKPCGRTTTNTTIYGCFRVGPPTG